MGALRVSDHPFGSTDLMPVAQLKESLDIAEGVAQVKTIRQRANVTKAKPETSRMGLHTRILTLFPLTKRAVARKERRRPSNREGSGTE
ncbi:hypothetical protein [Magnetospirillum molischianum]|uniref:Uncharacterized protein n=1 Tax=Magnetospirillum molischianum DSM 120 TaxID=1150626 RepID=H8FN64_MAGML|nr:hypothetical protein [Magnetospirillum molischianum]CCG39802.1 hypothetical protein PHAMO_10227 [Magnetospirillum molischianum DSM 120]